MIKNLIPGERTTLTIKKVATSSISTTTKKTLVHFQRVFSRSIKTHNKIVFSYKLMCLSVIAPKVLTFKVRIIIQFLGCYPNKSKKLLVHRI